MTFTFVALQRRLYDLTFHRRKFRQQAYHLFHLSFPCGQVPGGLFPVDCEGLTAEGPCQANMAASVTAERTQNELFNQ